ncbi:C-C motif chemokine 9-like isoform X1 [Microtus ochrogaster]|uniref:C-C motif chemokine n=1 Tax=Microtus ochrogaster TaxID=79684 RepID=A0ABM1U1Q9_MICOH|nr:C-C motif chemokine 9-like isoform X1 [Microtus ochrogaster]
MKPLTTAFSFLILAAALGLQAPRIICAAEREVLKAEPGHAPQVLHLGFEESSDCCFSYASRIKCSKFVYYFPTSGSCIKPGIIFVNKKGNRVCANPSDLKVQKCIKVLRPNS